MYYSEKAFTLKSYVKKLFSSFFPFYMLIFQVTSTIFMTITEHLEPKKCKSSERSLKKMKLLYVEKIANFSKASYCYAYLI